MLPGSNAQLKDQAVMFSAHYDHLGIVPGMPGDNIYNGAQDNATGVGILLEIARAYSLAKQAPPRSVYFASVTAEEQGLRGSEYFGKHPPVPAKEISLDLNYDDVPPWGVPEEVQVTGAERTTFYPEVQKMAKQFGLTIVPDPNPNAGHYYRSDHFSLARVGVPAFSIGEGELLQGTRPPVGRAEGERVRRQRLSPSQRRVSSVDGLCWRRGDGALRIRSGMGSRNAEERSGLEFPATSSTSRGKPAERSKAVVSCQLSAVS